MEHPHEHAYGNALVEIAVSGLRRYVENVHKGNVASAKRELGLGSTLDAWLNGTRTPSLSKLGPILEKMQAKLVFPGQETPTTRDVCFVNARTINAEEGAPAIAPEDYLAVPLVSEAGAGPGVVPIADHESWFLVYRSEPSIRTRSNLIAVRIAKGSTSMEPTLHPGDIVLVDRNDKNASRPGGIWLVMEPDGSGKIKRVKLDHVPAMRITRVTFYSDNVQEHPPEVYTLETDYEGDINRAVVGRVVWAWSDLSRK